MEIKLVPWKSVQKAVENINTTINEAIEGLDASDIYAVDAAMLKADGTKDKSTWALMRSWLYPSQAAEQQQPHWRFPCIVSWAA